MKDLYSYIFTKAYFFCINVFKEKEFPQYFAILTIIFIGVTNLYIILSLIEYLLLPDKFDFYGEYYKYFSLISGLLALVYFNYNKKYDKILSYYKGFSIEKLRKLKIYSIIYLLILFVGFFALGALLRSYYIANA